MDSEQLASELARADHLYKLGRLDEALRVYTEIVEADPALAWAHSRVGAILAQRNELTAAEEALLRAIELDPTLPQAHSNLGNVYYARGEYESALAKYQEAVALSPESSVFHENLHAAYKKLGKLQDAVVSLKQAHRLQREGAKREAKVKMEDVKQNVKGRLGCLSSAVLLVLTLLLGLILIISI